MSFVYSQGFPLRYLEISKVFEGTLARVSLSSDLKKGDYIVIKSPILSTLQEPLKYP